MRPLIITRPEKQSTSQRWGYNLLTLAFWAIFAYFFRPVLTMAAWVIGYSRFHDIMIENHGIEHLFRLLLIYALIIACMSLALIAWSLYNLLRYGHHEKRLKSPSPVTSEMLAEYFMVPPDDLRVWQSARRLTLYFDPSGKIVNADCTPDQKEQAEPGVGIDEVKKSTSHRKN
ncbi:MAG: poly-beta-1,6-N-acetyl-D-glucosamine biosynthesis protein PgaD [Deltaproteobacteria bacterium]|nr:poly-beta-1,6-N-acetyl-D-glucosamine biosynthesis protein PgaD [Deltaproteobacteria bacterium]